MTTTPDWQRDIENLSKPLEVPTAGIGAAVGISAASPDKEGGDFATVASMIRPEQLRDNVEFNPTPPIVQYQALAKATNYRPNDLGFLVRDPVFMSQIGAPESDNWRHWGTNYGFRFLYNPTTFNETLIAPPHGDPMMMLRDVQIGAIPASIDTGSGINVSLLLYRGEDLPLLQRSDYASFYPANKITEQQRDDILQRGTQADLEYLFRMCNGDPLDTWHGVSSDWGMLMPTLLVLSLGYSAGNRKIRGRISNLGWTHRLFAPGMVPILTEVSLQFSRQSDSYFQAGEEEVAATTDSPGGSVDDSVDFAQPLDIELTGPAPTGSSPKAGLDGAKGLVANARLTADHVRKHFNGVKSVGGTRSEPGSDHDVNVGKAIDIMVNYGKMSASSMAAGDQIALYYQQNYKAFGVKYIVWRTRIWNVERDKPGLPFSKWRHNSSGGRCPLNPSGMSSGDITYCHFDHVHISFK